jgi:hypothetical protein
MKSSMFSSDMLLLAIVICIIIVILRIGIMSIHRIIQIKEKISTAITINALCIPTLVFTFVITDILLKNFQIGETIYNVLMLYGVFTSIFGTAFLLIAVRKKHLPRQTIETTTSSDKTT